MADHDNRIRICTLLVPEELRGMFAAIAVSSAGDIYVQYVKTMVVRQIDMNERALICLPLVTRTLHVHAGEAAETEPWPPPRMNDLCATCGKRRGEHDARHPFKGG